MKNTGRHPEKALTAISVRNTKMPGFYADGNGLYLKVDKSGAKRWVQRLMIQGKRRDLGLGPVSLVSLAVAREQAIENRKVARAGGDPLAERRKAEEVPTFEEAARHVHKQHLPTWRNPKHAQQWISTLEQYALPHFGNKKVRDITSADVLNALSPIWTTKPETASRVRQRIGAVMKWAIAKGWRMDNPAEAITKALPKQDKAARQHQSALPYTEVSQAIATVQGSHASHAVKLAFEFLILTACRSGEVRGARWDEFDLKEKIWTIPAERMKAKRAHRVPLSPRAIEVLHEAQQLNAGNDWGFPSPTTGKALSDMALSKLMRDLGINAVPHGFRSSFRVWAGEQTSIPREVCEFALAHVIKNKAEAAYQRSDLFEKRRELMALWSAYLQN